MITKQRIYLALYAVACILALVVACIPVAVAQPAKTSAKKPVAIETPTAPAQETVTVREALTSIENIVASFERVLIAKEATTQAALAKLPVGGVVVTGAPAQQTVQMPEVSPVARACQDSILSISCGVQFLASMGSGAVDFVKALVPVGGQVISYHTAKRQYEFQAIAAKEATAQHAQAQATLQTAFNTNRDIANAPRQPGQVVNFADSYGINFGNGSQVWTPVTDSNNPTNPNPLVCVPTFGTSGAINGYTCPR